jgi:predicted phosphoribosyltransferase
LLFADRLDAARQLADALRAYEGAKPVVLAIPRGAVPMGRVLAERLGGELDVVLVRKLGSPDSAEFAIGAVDESGWRYVAPYAFQYGGDDKYLERECAHQMAVMRERRRLYTPGRAPIEVAGRTAIVVDDGLATGSTMLAALHAVRGRRPEKLVCAVPVASREALDLVRPHADEVVCLDVPEWFGAVGQFYASFPQVEDEEVVRLLRPRAAA